MASAMKKATGNVNLGFVADRAPDHIEMMFDFMVILSRTS